MSYALSITDSSTVQSTAELKYQMSLSVTKKAMDAQENVQKGLIEMLPPNPAGLGQNIDVYA